MATKPFSGGAPAVVSDVFQQVAALAASLRVDAKTFIDKAKAEVESLLAEPLDPPPAVPMPGVLNLPAGIDGLNLDGQAVINTNLTTYLESRIDVYTADYFNRIFPIDSNLAPAQAWVARVLSGVSVLDQTVEERIWSRERDRAQRDAQRATSEVLTSWAARGYPLPPGAAVGAVLMAQRTAMEQAAASSREIAIKKFDVEIEQVKRAIDLAIQMRVETIKNMSEYIKNAALRSAMPIQLKQAQSDLNAKMMGTAAEFFGLESGLEKYKLEAPKLVSDHYRDWAKFNYSTKLDRVKQRTELALQMAQMAATQAAAALNGLHASAAISGSDSSSTQYDGGYVGV